MPMHRPAHPGTILRDLLDGIYEETGQRLTVGEVATALASSRQTVSAILNGRTAVSPAMALKLATAFQTTTPELWLRLQENYDLAQARQQAHPEQVRVLWPNPAAGAAAA